MMLTRRSLIERVALAVAGSAMARAARSAVSQAPIVLRVFDSRSSASRRWRDSHTANAIDVLEQNSTRWRALRAYEIDGRVAGLTSWSDYVQARGALEARGRRLRMLTRSGALFYWEMG